MFIQGFYFDQKDLIYFILMVFSCWDMHAHSRIRELFLILSGAFHPAAECRTVVTNAQIRKDKSNFGQPNGHFKSGKISGEIRIVSRRVKNPETEQMYWRHSCIGKITRFLSFKSIRILCPTVFNVSKVKENQTKKFSRMNCTVLLLFFLPQALIHPIPAFRITTPSSELGKVQFSKTRHGTLMHPCANHRFCLWFEPFTDRFRLYPSFQDHYVNCVWKFILGPVSKTRKMKILRIELGMNSPLLVPNLSLYYSIGNQMKNQMVVQTIFSRHPDST